MDTEKQFVYDSWKNLNLNVHATAVVCENWWSVLVRRYSEEWRYYHTLDHVHHLLKLFEQWRMIIAEPDNVLLAIFFHDLVYDPTASDNEILSTVLFKKYSLEAKLSPQVVSRVSDMIMATVSHSADKQTDDLDLCLFLDFDLAILGQESEEYKVYAAKIRKEYCHYDDDAYRKGRLAVLRSLLQSPSLYASEILKEVYEKQARDNVEEEIASLEAFAPL